MTKSNTSFSKKLKDMGLIVAFDVYNEEDHPRDENGRWTAGGGGVKGLPGESAAKGSLAALSSKGSASFFAHKTASDLHKQASSHALPGSKEHEFHTSASTFHETAAAKIRLTKAQRGRGETAIKRDMSLTQKELPAVAAETAKQVPHAFIPAGNQKTPEHKLAVDPNRTTQKEMPAVRQPLSRQDRIQAAAESAGKWASRATTVSAQRKPGSGK